MALLPLLLNCMDDDDLFEPRFPSTSFALSLLPRDLQKVKQSMCPRNSKRCPCRPRWQLDRKHKEEAAHTAKGDKAFQVSIDVEHFAPNEITVKTVDNSLIVEGKHEEKEDGHGFISRQFLRRYHIPEEYDIEAVTSTMSSDGVLTVRAPKISKAIEGRERIIQIQETGPAASSIRSCNDKEEVMETENTTK